MYFVWSDCQDIFLVFSFLLICPKSWLSSASLVSGHLLMFSFVVWTFPYFSCRNSPCALEFRPVYSTRLTRFVMKSAQKTTYRKFLQFKNIPQIDWIVCLFWQIQPIHLKGFMRTHWHKLLKWRFQVTILYFSYTVILSGIFFQDPLIFLLQFDF